MLNKLQQPFASNTNLCRPSSRCLHTIRQPFSSIPPCSARCPAKALYHLVSVRRLPVKVAMNTYKRKKTGLSVAVQLPWHGIERAAQHPLAAKASAPGYQFSSRRMSAGPPFKSAFCSFATGSARVFGCQGECRLARWTIRSLRAKSSLEAAGHGL